MWLGRRYTTGNGCGVSLLRTARYFSTTGHLQRKSGSWDWWSYKIAILEIILRSGWKAVRTMKKQFCVWRAYGVLIPKICRRWVCRQVSVGWFGIYIDQEFRQLWSSGSLNINIIIIVFFYRHKRFLSPKSIVFRLPATSIVRAGRQRLAERGIRQR